MSRSDQAIHRTAEQNAKLHAMCRDFAKQMKYGGFLWSEEDWKRIFLGAKFGQAVVPDPFGHGLVVVNKKRSSKLDMEQMAELIGEVEAFGVQNGIEWTDDED
jgi:hypothetical protein